MDREIFIGAGPEQRIYNYQKKWNILGILIGIGENNISNLIRPSINTCVFIFDYFFRHKQMRLIIEKSQVFMVLYKNKTV